MGIELNRRRLIAVSTGAALSLAAGRSSTLAQDGTPAGDDEPLYGIVSGPGENEVTITHAQGDTVVAARPGTVLCFDLTSADTLQALGVDIAGLPEIAGSQDAIDTSGAETIGSLFEPDYEKVVSMNPDLIIVGGRSAEVFPELGKIAPTIDLSFQTSDFIAGLESNTAILATLFGKEDDAQTALDEIRARVAYVQAMAGDIESGMVVMTSGGSVTALAPGTARAGRGALIYETLGIRPPLDDLDTATHGEPISFEFLLEHDPQWLFVIDRDVATGTEDAQPAQQVLDNDLMRQTTAWKDGNIVYLNPFDWYVIVGAGLGSMNRMLGELETAFSA